MGFWLLFAVVWSTKTIREWSHGTPDYVTVTLDLFLTDTSLGMAIAYRALRRQAMKQS